MLKSPLVSVIISTYNSERFFEGKLLDLIRQTIFESIEIIIINSGSEQDERNIIKKYLKSHRNIKYVETEYTETIYKAWNRGIKIANGLFITNSNTDDRLKKDALEILSNILINNPDTALVYADQYESLIPNQTFKEAKHNKVIRFPEFDKILQLDRCIIGSQPMWRSKLHFENGIWFDESYEVSGDHDFELRVALNYNMKHLPQVLGTFFYSKSITKSSEDFRRNNIELFEIRKKHIQRYIQVLNDSEINNLIKYFTALTKPPNLIFLLRYWLLRRFLKRENLYTLEFSYYFLVKLLIEKGDFTKAGVICNRYLSKKKSALIEDEFNKIKHHQLSEK